MKRLFTLIAPFLSWTVAFSQTTVSGNITGVWDLSGSPYIVIGNISVVDSLIIDPGVSVQFNVGGFSITAGGGDKFIARGTCSNPITFEAYSIQNPGTWNGLVFSGSGNDDSLFYCNVQSATDGIFITGGSSTYISNCIIHNNSLSGIEAKNDANPFIANCTIYENVQFGIRVYNLNGGNTLAKIFNCVIIYNCWSGIVVRTAWFSGNAHPEISNCTLALNYYYGLDVQQNVGTSDATIYNSIMAYNGQYGIHKENGSAIGVNDITYNCFWQNDSGSVYNLSGIGFGCAAQQTGAYFNGNGDSSDLNQNICYNPKFVDLYCLRCNSGYLLQSSSKCLGLARTNLIFGQIDTSIHQIGAFPTCSPTCTSPCTSACDPFGVGIKHSFAASDTDICEKFCINFYDSSLNNPIAWQWFFPGGDPSSSTDQNPTNICYDVPGTYDVTRIITNANGNDTLTLPNYITVYPTPPAPNITQVDYVLTSSSSSSYQWQFNTVNIPGATNQSYTVLQTGYYTVVVGDSNSCKNSTTIYVLISGDQTINFGSGISIYPDPSLGNLTIDLMSVETGSGISIDVMNALGQKVFSSVDKISSIRFKKEIDLTHLISGIYYITLQSENFSIKKKILVAH